VVTALPAEPGPADGDLTTADVRRIWPELLSVVKRHKRTTEALLKNAQVHELAGGVLTLATPSPALVRRLNDDLNKDVVREALNELLGVRWRVNAVHDDPHAPGAGAAARSPGPPPSPQVVQAAARAAEVAEANELMAERDDDQAAAAAGDPAPVVDQEQAALSLLREQLGARPIDG
jgi:DNA polymerase-3 subunit gamma/tau